jgi:hypothetical protein
MSRALARAALPGLLLLGCTGAPLSPMLTGQGAGQPGDTLTFAATTSVPRGEMVRFRFEWGDGTSTEWSPVSPAADTFRHWHAYADTGGFGVRVQLRDSRDRESDWSDPCHVAVAFAGPLVPTGLVAPAFAFPDTDCVFEAAAAHVRGESVACEFAWSDSVVLRSAFVPAGTGASVSRRFRGPGRFSVRVRANDAAGNASPWSDTAVTVVEAWPLAPPQRLTLGEFAGVYVRLRWDRGRNDDSTRYGIWFRGVGARDFTMVDEVGGASYVHDPAGGTGYYVVSARRSGGERFAAETLSTVPAYTDTVVLGELNTLREAGAGWDTLGGSARTLSMRDSANAAQADLYFTDFTPGYLGPTFYLAAPQLGPADPGGVVPAGPWRRTWLLGLVSGGQEPLPQYDSLLYQNAVDVSAFVSYSAMYTPEGYYALVRTFDVNLNDGSVKLVAWFQRVRGLRLIQWVRQAGR